ncbi:MAG: leucine dehydrogenase, partial [Bacteroidia bacterium]|nr:leucine dehydrogenase [Bacteroidia bacterium]
SENLNGKRVGVQGIGKVGKHLVELLVKEDAKVFITDISEHNLKQVSEFYGCDIVATDDFYETPMDIYAPCALGATLNTENIEKLKCDIVAGCANNQLAKESVHGQMLMDKGILYAPDFLINAGGLINVYSELTGYNRQRAMDSTTRIYDVTLDILKKSKEDKIPTYVAAKQIASDRIRSIKNVRSTY